MDDTASRTFWLGYHGLMFLTLAGLLGALPVLVTGARPRKSIRRFLLTAAAGYLLAVLCLGFYAYSFLPLQYTRDFTWNKLPEGWSLSESHADALEKARKAQPDEAARVTARVQDERIAFVKEWGALSVAGLAVASVVLAFYLRLKPVPSPLMGEG
jgi:hypothetical protein